MNLVLLAPEDFDALPDTLGVVARARLTGRRATHVLGIHRAEVGDSLRVGLIDGPIGSARITNAEEGAVELEVVLDAVPPPPPPLPLTLVLALPRPPTLKKVLQAVAAMGVKKIVLIESRRVERSYWQSPVVTREGIHEQLLLGLEQGCDTRLPHVTTRRRFRAFVEDELPAIVEGTLALVAHPEAAEQCPHAVDRQVTLVVGPEGGFLAPEIELLERAGLRAVTLGARPLRVEHAVPALIGRLL